MEPVERLILRYDLGEECAPNIHHILDRLTELMISRGSLAYGDMLIKVAARTQDPRAAIECMRGNVDRIYQEARTLQRIREYCPTLSGFPPYLIPPHKEPSVVVERERLRKERVKVHLEFMKQVSRNIAESLREPPPFKGSDLIEEQRRMRCGRILDDGRRDLSLYDLWTGPSEE